MRRFFLYSHDGFGLGHTRRHAAIAAALADLDREAAILLASGADDVYRLGLPPNVDVLKLPGLRKGGPNQYLSRRLPSATAEIRALRAAVLESAVKTFRPNVTLIDKHPFGACGEFCGALKVLKNYGSATVLGLRDILDDPEAVSREWSPHDLPDSIADYYDLVLLYGERRILNPIHAYGFPESVAKRTRFCGYVVSRTEAEVSTDWTSLASNGKPEGKPLVLATTGGGEDGSLVLESFIRAAAGAHWHGIAIAGPMTPPSEFAVLRRLSEETGVHLHTFLSNLAASFAFADALVCMGGYNTIAEAVSQGIPTVCVPRTTPRSEQWLRARAFERLGLLRTIHPDQLDPDVLREAIQASLGGNREALRQRAGALLRFDGAQRAAASLLSLATTRTPDNALDWVGPSLERN